jgi:hypothetical protein
MTDERMFDHRPDPELGAALRRALDPARDDHAAFVARVMARYDGALSAAMVPTWQVLAAWSRRGIAAAVASAALAGFLLGRALQAPDAAATLDAALTPVAFINATDPPDASVVFASLVEPR